jgi:hypothetical protein
LFYLLLPLFYIFSTPNSIIILFFCSSFIPMMIEDVLADLTDARTDPMCSYIDGSLPDSSLLNSSRRPIKTDLTGCRYRSNQLTDLETGQARLRPAHEHMLQCVSKSSVNKPLLLHVVCFPAAHPQNYPAKESNQCEADPKSHREIETFTFIPIY